jgi:uncharacterized protein (DUF1684 family)
MRYLFLIYLIGSLLPACSAPEALSAYEQGVLQERFDKDLSMRDPNRTALRKQEISKFRGLRYFPINEKYRFTVPLQPTTEVLKVKMQKRKAADPIEYVCAGYVEIPFSEGTQKLMVFRVEELPEGTYWLPFTDATTNKESYGGGRYIDVTTNTDGKLLIDFNKAYNPLCDYNPDDYNCTLPPSQNRLPIPVRVGEQKSLLILSE